MTDDDPDDRDFNELADILANRVIPPEDVVPHKGMDRETILRLNASALTSVGFEEDPPLEETADGAPLAVGPIVRSRAMMGRTLIPRYIVEAAGLTEADVPNLRIYDPEPK